MDDLPDLDAVEEVLDDRGDRRGSRNNEEDEFRRRSRSRRDRSRRRDRSEQRKAEDAAKEEESRKAREEERKVRKVKEEEEERQRQMEDATRGERTVLVSNVNVKCNEKDVYQFFAGKAGKVRDVQVIRDQRSGRSKGLSYVEFYMQESVNKALQLTGQMLQGSPVRVQPSQAEKNRATQIARNAAAMSLIDQGLKLYVGGLEGNLANISDEDLKKLFVTFGEIEFIDLHKDPYTNKSKGFAFVKFKNATDGREAIAAMNGFDVMGQKLMVGIAHEATAQNLMLTNAAPGSENVNPADGQAEEKDLDPLTENADVPGSHPGLLKDASQRLQLMRQLAERKVIE